MPLKPETENDSLADELFVTISDAVMKAIEVHAKSGSYDPMNIDQQRSFLRAVGGTMALFVHAAALAGVPEQAAARVIQSGFNSKRDLPGRLTKDVPS